MTLESDFFKQVDCKRCGRVVTSLKKPLIEGTEELKDKYDGICSDCMRDDERDVIMHEQAMAIVRNARKV